MVDVPYIPPKEYVKISNKFSNFNNQPFLVQLIETNGSPYKLKLFRIITKCLDYNCDLRPDLNEIFDSIVEIEQNILYDAKITENNFKTGKNTDNDVT